ncbi:MAG: hypothetical protein ACOCT9_02700 [archaeon]
MIEHGYRAYQTYLGIKLHFKEDSKYDFFEYKGNVSATLKSFQKRKEKWQFAKLDKMYSDYQELILLIAVNMFLDPKTFVLKLIKDKAYKNYQNYIAYEQSLSYELGKELDNLINEYGEERFLSFFETPDNGYPVIFQKYVSGEITPWFLIIMDEATDFINKANINEPVMWNPKIYQLRQFKKFMTIDLDVVEKELTKRF